MDTEDRLPATSLRSVYHHLAIKAARTQERRVKDAPQLYNLFLAITQFPASLFSLDQAQYT